MMHWIGRIVLVGGILSAVVLAVLGAILTAYGHANFYVYAKPVAEGLGIGQWINTSVVVFGLIGLHAIPLILLYVAWRSGNLARAGLGWALLVLAPATGWIGFEGLILQGDWGDFVLWGPYLLTGLFMAIVGACIVARRWHA